MLWTGGAHCCYLDQIFDFSYRPAHKTEIDFRDSGARASDRQRPRDPAERRRPLRLRLHRLRRLGVADPDLAVPDRRSRRHHAEAFPALISSDAARWWSRYLATRTSTKDNDVRGILAAWAADESLLGDGAAAEAKLRQIAAGGDLDHGSGAPKGATYVATLWRFLGSHGYLR